MIAFKSAAGVLVMMAAIGFTGCNGGDGRHDRDRPQDHADEHRDQPRDAPPSDRDHDAHRDDRSRDDKPQ